VSSTEKPRRPLVARDLMAEVVVTVPRHMSPRGAARLLARAGVSAAPVVDADGRCVGLVAAGALVPLLAGGSGTRSGALHEGACSDWQILEGPATGPDEVAAYVQAAAPLVGPQTPFSEVVRLLADAGAYRAVVVDAAGAPLGTVSADRVLAVVARGRARASDPEVGFTWRLQTCREG
jgi:CBS-domain-containing membrane protein